MKENTKVRKKGMIFFILFIFISYFVFLLPFSIFPTITSADTTKSNIKSTLYVGGSGPNNYTNIRSAIQNANNGDIIFVFSGKYYDHLIIDKKINLIGENRNTTIIDGSEKGNIITVTVDMVKIRGFTITGSGKDNFNAGIILNNVKNCEIENNNISQNNEFGIYLKSSASNVIKENLVISNKDIGIRFEKSIKNNITGNIISDYEYKGIYFEESSNNKITNNYLSLINEGAIHLGDSPNSYIANNYFFNNEEGIYLTNSPDSYIENNTVSNNSRGIVICGSSDNCIVSENTVTSNLKYNIELVASLNCIVTGNIINGKLSKNILESQNSEYGIWFRNARDNIFKGNNISNNKININLEDSKNNKIYNNNFFNGTEHAYDDQTYEETYGNSWDYKYPSGGNYWDDYSGLDNGANSRVKGDGIGDTNIPHLGLDNYPFIKPLDIKNYIIKTKPNTIIDNGDLDNASDDNGKPGKIFSSNYGIIAISITTISIIIMISSFVVGTEIGKYGFFSTITPLYFRKKKKGELNYIKGSVRGYILGNPGERYNDIKRVLKLPNGTLTYYLNVLEKEGIIRSEREGFNKRFYPTKGKFEGDSIELTEIQQAIRWIIKNNPGISQVDIQSQLGISQQSLNYHIQLMSDARIIRLEREGNKSKCYVIEEVS